MPAYKFLYTKVAQFEIEVGALTEEEARKRFNEEDYPDDPIEVEVRSRTIDSVEEIEPFSDYRPRLVGSSFTSRR